MTNQENRLRKTIKNFNRQFPFVKSSINKVLEDMTEKQRNENIGQYLSLVDTFGERNMSASAIQNLTDTLSSEDIDLEKSIRANDPVLQLTTQTRVKNLYKRFTE